MTNLTFAGTGSYSISGSAATITVPKILNNTVGGGHSGTVKVQLWLFASPYAGPGQIGYDVADVTNYSTLNSNSSYASQTVTVTYTAPPTGTYYPTLLLEEYDGSSRYVTDDSLSFTSTVAVGGGGTSTVNLGFKGGAAFATTPSTGTVSISVPEIDNLSATGISGTARVELWFFNQPYTGGTQVGYDVGNVTNYAGQLNPHAYYAGQTVTVAYTPPPTGTYYSALLLKEYVGSAYQTDAYVNLTNVATGSTTFGIGSAVGTGSTGGTGITGGNGTPITTDSLALYRFFDRQTGTQFLTSDANERSAVKQSQATRYAEETTGFGAATQNDANALRIYRLFDTKFGTHFYTSNASELAGITTPGSSNYRSDLTYEPNNGFYEHLSQQVGDVAVHRFFETSNGTHFYTGSDSEYVGLVTKGAASYRADFVDEGIAFYAPKAAAV